MDNPVRSTHTGSLETSIGYVHDASHAFMTEQQIKNKNNNTNRSRQLLRSKHPSNALGFIYEEVPMFDVKHAHELGQVFMKKITQKTGTNYYNINFKIELLE